MNKKISLLIFFINSQQVAATITFNPNSAVTITTDATDGKFDAAIQGINDFNRNFDRFNQNFNCTNLTLLIVGTFTTCYGMKRILGLNESKEKFSEKKSKFILPTVTFLTGISLLLYVATK